MNYKKLKEDLLKNSQAFRKEYLKRDLPLELAHLIVRNRVAKNLTQEQLAKLVGTKQPGIARAERGTSYPSVMLLEKIAQALKMELDISFKETNTWEISAKIQSKDELSTVAGRSSTHSNINKTLQLSKYFQVETDGLVEIK